MVHYAFITARCVCSHQGLQVLSKGSLQKRNPAHFSQHLIRMSLFSDLFSFSVSSGLQLYLRFQVLRNCRMINAKVFCTAFAGFLSLSLLRIALPKSCQSNAPEIRRPALHCASFCLRQSLVRAFSGWTVVRVFPRHLC